MCTCMTVSAKSFQNRHYCCRSRQAGHYSDGFERFDVDRIPTHRDFRNFTILVRNADILHEYLVRNDLETRMYTIFIQIGVSPTGCTRDTLAKSRRTKRLRLSIDHFCLRTIVKLVESGIWSSEPVVPSRKQRRLQSSIVVSHRSLTLVRYSRGWWN